MAFFNLPMSLCHLPISPGTHKYLELYCLEGSGEKPFQNMSPLAALESLISVFLCAYSRAPRREILSLN